MKILFSSFFVLIFNSTAMSTTTIVCDRVNSDGFTFMLDGSEGNLLSYDLGTHKIADILHLPDANQSYFYSKIDIDFDECAASSTNSLIVQCFKQDAIINLSSPQMVFVGDALFYTEKLTSLNGSSEYYRMVLSMTLKDSGQVIQEVFSYDLTLCSID